MPEVTITINGQPHQVADHLTIIQACDQLGIEIPRFCYHKRLEVAGNCRMCLVEVEKAPKPVPSCVQKVMPGMVIYTDSPLVKKAREGVMEFMLINHPLDCPVCDQGGECDLQDQAFHYGKGESAYREEKRIVADKDLGPLIATHMTRCIHCMRCVRFMDDIAGSPEIGAIGRGEESEIATYLGRTIQSELSGNIVDLCPVGALNLKPSAYKARSWEMRKTPSIDVCDALGSNVYIDSRDEVVIRIRPRENEAVNQEWLSDKSRFSYDALQYQRLTQPLLRDKDGQLVAVSWDAALDEIGLLLQKVPRSQPVMKTMVAGESRVRPGGKAGESGGVGVIAGDYTDMEMMFSAMQLFDHFSGSGYECRQRGEQIMPTTLPSYLFSAGIEAIKEADYVLLLGGNLRYDAPLLNARLYQRYRQTGVPVALFGRKISGTYPIEYLGDDFATLQQIAAGKHPHCEVIRRSKRPLIIVSTDAMCSPEFQLIGEAAAAIALRFGMISDEWFGLNFLHNRASMAGGLYLGFWDGGESDGGEVGRSSRGDRPQLIPNLKRQVLFLLGADEVDLERIPATTKVIYVGHHADRALARADIVLPSPAYTEKRGSYLNLEGRIQQTAPAVKVPGEARCEWEIILGLAKRLGVDLGYKDWDGMWWAITRVYPQFRGKALGQVVDRGVNLLWDKDDPGRGELGAANGGESVVVSLPNPVERQGFFTGDVLTRNSRTMAECLLAGRDAGLEKESKENNNKQ